MFSNNIFNEQKVLIRSLFCFLKNKTKCIQQNRTSIQIVMYFNSYNLFL